PALKYKPLKIKDAPGGYPGFEHHMTKGGLLAHTEGVTALAILIADFVADTYGPVNRDFVISAALLHDLMRLYDFKKEKKDYSLVPKLLEHEQLIACELYARGFPEEVISVVLNHLKAENHNLEGMIVHYADTIDAFSDYYFRELIKHAIEKELLGK
ncbi:MAG: HD domain-containing protein, partial [Candidatus Aenigmatarchaeota archaeon]